LICKNCPRNDSIRQARCKEVACLLHVVRQGGHLLLLTLALDEQAASLPHPWQSNFRPWGHSLWCDSLRGGFSNLPGAWVLFFSKCQEYYFGNSILHIIPARQPCCGLHSDLWALEAFLLFIIW
jgi:hypothetical protein